MNVTPWEILIYIAIVNIILSGIHYFLGILKDKTESKIDDRLYSVLSFTLKTLEWLMMNRGPK